MGSSFKAILCLVFFFYTIHIKIDKIHRNGIKNSTCITILFIIVFVSFWVCIVIQIKMKKCFVEIVLFTAKLTYWMLPPFISNLETCTKNWISLHYAIRCKWQQFNKRGFKFGINCALRKKISENHNLWIKKRPEIKLVKLINYYMKLNFTWHIWIYNNNINLIYINDSSPLCHKNLRA